MTNLIESLSFFVIPIKIFQFLLTFWCFQALRETYRKLNKVPVERRSGGTFKTLEATFLDSLPQLFDITVKRLLHSHLITDDDRDFLINYWDKTISSTRDMVTKVRVEKKLERQEKYQQFCTRIQQVETTNVTECDLNSTHSSLSSGDEYVAPLKKRKKNFY